MKSFVFKYLPIFGGLSLVLSIVAARALAYLAFGGVGDRVVSAAIFVASIVSLFVILQWAWSGMRRL
jgi:hypothetical protein